MYSTIDLDDIGIDNRILSIEEMLNKDYEENNKIVFEGFISSFFNFVRKIFKLLINAIIRLCRFIINIIKKVLSKIRNLFMKVSNKDKEKRKIQVEFCMEEYHIVSKSYSSLHELKIGYINALSAILKQIEKCYNENKKQIESVKKDYERRSKYAVSETTYYRDLPRHRPYENPGSPENIDNEALQANSFIDLLNIEKMDTIDFNLLDQILSAKKDVVKLYNTLTKQNSDELLQVLHTMSGGESISIDEPLLKNQSIRILVSCLYRFDAEHQKYEYLPEYKSFNIYPVFPDNKEGERLVKIWAKTKYQWVKSIIEQLENMIVENNAECVVRLKDLYGDKWKELLIQEKIDIGRDHLSKLIFKKLQEGSLKNYHIDLRDNGLGCFVFSDQFMSSQKYSNQLNKYINTAISDIGINNFTSYDLTIFAHGNYRRTTLLDLMRNAKDVSEDQYNEASYLFSQELSMYRVVMDEMGIPFSYNLDLNTEYKVFANVIKKFKDRSNLFKRLNFISSNTAYKNKLGLKYSSIIGSDKPVFQYSRWIVENGFYLYTLNGQPFDDIELYIHFMLKSGFKNINVISCNLGKIVLDKYLRKNKNVKITYLTRNALL